MTKRCVMREKTAVTGLKSAILVTGLTLGTVQHVSGTWHTSWLQ